MVETRTALIQLANFGIVIVRVKKDVLQSLDDATENLTAAILETGGQRRPLLIDIRAAIPLEQSNVVVLACKKKSGTETADAAADNQHAHGS